MIDIFFGNSVKVKSCRIVFNATAPLSSLESAILKDLFILTYFTLKVQERRGGYSKIIKLI